MKFESENKTPIENISPDELTACLAKIDGRENSFAYLTAPNGDYIQVGGGPKEFTVELRRNLTGNSFRHLKARRRDELSTSTRELRIGGSSVKVSANEVVGPETVSMLFLSFLTGTDFLQEINWRDMTDFFSEGESI